MKQPLGIVILCYLLGILLGNLTGVASYVWLTLAGAFCVGALARERLRTWLLPPLLVFCGAANFSVLQQPLSPIDLRRLVTHEPQLVTVRGVVERVDLRAVPALRGDEDQLRTSARLRLEAIQTRNGSWQPAHGRVLASTRTPDEPMLRAGQRVELFGLLEPPPGPFAPGLFDYRRHLALRGIHHQFVFDADTDLRVIHDAAPALTERFQSWAMAVLGRGFPEDDLAVGMLWALCVGWLVPLTDEVSEPFMRSGTMHLFAISGQHVALIAGILVALLRFFRAPRRAVGWLVIPLLWFYTAATGWQPSAIRSTIMMTVIVLGWTLERPTDLLNSLAAAAFLILLWDPRELFHAGFQLSFAVVASIGLLLPPIEQWRQRLVRPDPLLPPELRPRWQRLLDAPLRFVSLSVGVSLAAWLGSLPLIMAYFHLITPVGLIANIVVVQFGSLALAAALGSLICFPLAPFLTDLFNHAAWFFSHAMASSSGWFSELPGAWYHVKAPPLGSVLAYYLLLWLVMSGRLWRQRRWALPASAVLAVAMIAAWQLEHRHTRLTVLPLNGGHALFLEQPGAENWLIDCGDALNWRYRTRPFLQARGVNRLDNFIVTHGDVRHMGAATNVLADFKPRRIVLNPLSQRSAPYRQFAASVEAHTSLVPRPAIGDQLGPWRVLHPAVQDRFTSADSGALVLSLQIGGTMLLHLPDLDDTGQELLRERHPELRAEVVLASPDRSGVALAEATLEMLRPRQLVYIDAKYPAGERADAETRQRWGARVPTVTFTSDHGAVELRLAPDAGKFIIQLPSKSRNPG